MAPATATNRAHALPRRFPYASHNHIINAEGVFWHPCRTRARASAATRAAATARHPALQLTGSATAKALSFPSLHSPTSMRCPAITKGASPIINPSRLVLALEKLARVGQAPQPTWLDMYLAVTEPALSQLSLSEMATLARSLRLLGLEVPEQWARALLQASEAVLPGAVRAADVADLVLWAAADGRLVPEPSWVGAALQRIQYLAQIVCTSALSPCQAADVAWAVARMGYRPADPLLECLAAATLGSSLEDSDRAIPHGQGRADSDPIWISVKDPRRQPQSQDGNAAGSSRRSDLDPDSNLDIASDFQHDARPAGNGLLELPPEQLARLAWAFASYNYFPPEKWARAYWLGGIWARGLSPEGVTAVLWSLGCMQLPLEPLWLRNYCLTTAGRLHEVPPEGLINALWSIAACREVARAASTSLPWNADAGRDSAETESVAGGATDAASESGEGAASAETASARGGVGVNVGEGGEVETRRRLREAELEYLAGAELLQQQLQALLQLRDGSCATAAQQEAFTHLQEALDRRLGNSGAAGPGNADSSSGGVTGAAATATASAASAFAAIESVTPPAAWIAEWYNATRPYLELPYMDRTLVVKALWATASLELAPPPSWLRRLAVVVSALLADGALEPLEMLYASRSADALLARRLTKPQLAAAAEASVQADEDQLEEDLLREALARFAADSFTALGRQRHLPASWRRLNPRFPPYAQPKRVEDGKDGPRTSTV